MQVFNLDTGFTSSSFLRLEAVCTVCYDKSARFFSLEIIFFSTFDPLRTQRVIKPPFSATE